MVNNDDKNLLKYKFLLNLLNENSNRGKTEDDKTFRNKVTGQITVRDEEYTHLLTHFVSITKLRNYLKEFFKWSFYIVVIVSMCVFISMTGRLFDVFIEKATVEQMLSGIPLFVTAIVGLVSIIIAIPIAITKYLFSTKEDKNITDIILHTQEHDTTGRQWALEFKKIADEINDQRRNSDVEMKRDDRA